VVEQTCEGNLDMTAFAADSMSFPGPYLVTDFLPAGDSAGVVIR
jgi:hypothetical protein